MGKNYKEMLEVLATESKEKIINELELVIKPIPDMIESGVLDSRVKEVSTRHPFINPNINGETFVYKGIPIGAIRTSMGFENIDISNNNVNSTHKTIKGSEKDIDIMIYTPKGHQENLPCLVFFHGGGFFGGSVNTVENPCKSISDKANAVVVSVDYRLAPENKFPSGLTDCFDAVKWVSKNAEELNIDKNRVGVAGDSAGGNLAAVCSLMDREQNTNIIKFQALIYPLVNLSNKEVEGYKWTIDDYEIEADSELIMRGIDGLRQSTYDLEVIYLNDSSELENPYVSPLLSKDFSNQPKTLVVTAEFDYLRTQGEVYGKKLKEAGNNVKVIRYKGVDHAFIDKSGIYPQAEDCFKEISKLINS